ncbi:MAG: T9SS type A sorting domain-containing protein [Flavobacteriaceae bacterium]|nr:T9SS type A sorting domain-containing protein [Flavobacteriaceae bacterium]
MKNIILSFMLLIGSSITTNAQNIRLTLDNISTDISCNDIWIEEGINLSLESTTTEDCSTGSCFFEIETTYLWLFPSRLSIDLSSVQNIERLEIDIIDACGPDCTLAFLVNLDGETIESTYNTISGSPETLIIENPTESMLSKLAISSCEGQIHEIRIYQNILSNDLVELDKKTLYMYTNPSNDLLNVGLENDQLQKIELYSVTGQLIFEKDLNTNFYALNIDNYSSGNYYIRVYSQSGGVINSKFIKK